MEQDLSGEARGMRSVTAELRRLEDDFRWSVNVLNQLEDGTRATSTSRPETAFDYATLRLTSIADASWWFQARNRLIELLICHHAPDSVLWDIGGGVGTVSKHLQRSGVGAIVVEPDPSGARAATTKGLMSIAGSIEDLSLPDRSILSIGLFDVVEHIEDSIPLLTEVRRVLAPGGRLFVTAPALPTLWSDADEESGHFRRYTPSTIRREAEEAGLAPLASGYWFKTLVLPMIMSRTLPYRLGRRASPEDHARQLEPSSDTAVRAILQAERLMSPLPIPGTSVYGVFTPSG